MVGVTYNVIKTKHLTRTALNHKQKVLGLYKEALKFCRYAYDDQLEVKEKIQEMRQRFEANKDIKDFRIAKKLLKEGQNELFRDGLWEDYNFTYSPNGTAYQQSPEPTDAVLDYWTYLEKAMYPYYFARREQRKQEYIKLFESEYGDAKKLIGVHEEKDYSEIIKQLNDRLGNKEFK